MSDYEVTLVNDSMQEFYVRFFGPPESKLTITPLHLRMAPSHKEHFIVFRPLYQRNLPRLTMFVYDSFLVESPTPCRAPLLQLHSPAEYGRSMWNYLISIPTRAQVSVSQVKEYLLPLC